MSDLPLVPRSPASLPKVMQKLDDLEREIASTQITFERLNKIVDETQAWRFFFGSVKQVADRAGEVWIEAEAHLGEQLEKEPKAKGTLRRGAQMAPRGDTPTLAERGLTGDAGKKRAARARKLNETPKAIRRKLIESLKADGKGITPAALLAKQRQDAKTTKKHAIATAVFSEEGPFDVEPAAFELDAQEATDLIVFRARDMRIAARVRRPGFFKSYGNEFTIRARRDSGAKTELSKIVDGWGDWLFYGHAEDCDAPRIEEWMLVDLHALRAALIRNASGSVKLKFDNKWNSDGTVFKWFDVRSFPPNPPILVSASDSVRSLMTRRDRVVGDLGEIRL